ncbi:MAG: hypothetical protein J0I68_00835 [Achromobacter sp.]|jgi:hypothetical protein|uniref:Uncharacterized protein n=1 Tax=Achromobacter insuavis TaxID=1287735 RepID=A0A6J5AGS0_9BURK|nr:MULTISPECIES: hypothetical protein [Achromobacter]MBN9637048.1 hypothetical protein [Achromobacter sp.]CAB3665268.1 hypothetical protein LMG26845_03487 [Achromobacter insuavis]CUJ26220.1 Uncharacterised protein [Achromobacter sp. 2789STDY5608633]CUJ79730.1 Uncharacterised protein [Achromobacter sp. 2789STDY5608628]
MLKIEKFIDGQHEKTIKAPAFLVSLASKMLPESGHSKLMAQGINLRAMAQAKRSGTAYSTSFSVRERGISKRIVVSLA